MTSKAILVALLVLGTLAAAGAATAEGSVSLPSESGEDCLHLDLWGWPPVWVGPCGGILRPR
ncbi:MAG: hypothetical protein QOE90_1783 [Thermoplasmata archaeon]|jgi:hypothetical protein|nr:hypothetical protein [Thermoplasmata archaeon]